MVPDIDFNSHRDDPRGARPATVRARYRAMDGIVTEAEPGTLEHFLIERYFLYTADEEQRLYRARVHHRPYPLQRADVRDFEESAIWAAGLRRSQWNPLRHYAREVSVKVYGLEALTLS